MSRHYQTQPARSSRASQQRAVTRGWLIARAETDSGGDESRYLQIGTGQWCSARYATLFPLRSTAKRYAIDFGYQPGTTATIVPFTSAAD